MINFGILGAGYIANCFAADFHRVKDAAIAAVAGELQEGETTVGGQIESSHLAPSPVGAEVSATATLTKIEGRKLYFEIEARQGKTLLGKGTHLRFIVNREKFLGKLL